jgi:hypothetical protein
LGQVVPKPRRDRVHNLPPRSENGVAVTSAVACRPAGRGPLSLRGDLSRGRVPTPRDAELLSSWATPSMNAHSNCVAVPGVHRSGIGVLLHAHASGRDRVEGGRAYRRAAE